MPDYRIPADLHNPGQFFACCGLFELANLIAPGAEARFTGDFFLLNTSAVMPPKILLEAGEDLSDKPYDATLEPLTIRIHGEKFVLSWWLNETLTAKTALKTWGGQQTPRGVFSELLVLLDSATSVDGLFTMPVYSKSRFGVDARSAWDALDAGYSPNDIGQNAVTFPWVEILAVIGLEGFRPQPLARSRYRYYTWRAPFPLVAARAACAASWPGLEAEAFEFEIAGRGQGYKTFLFAKGA